MAALGIISINQQPGTANPAPAGGALRRELGHTGAVALGLGSIIGTGVYVSLSMATGIAGSGIITAIVIGAGLAFCNGISSAQLAASHPVSGGTYEYGYCYLNPAAGFAAGWMFLCAKSASAAAAALGIGSYVSSAWGLESRAVATLMALVVVVVLTLIVARGLRLSSGINLAVVCLSLGALLAFTVKACALEPSIAAEVRSPQTVRSTLHAAALMFVAYTGYGRIATLGEEVKSPRSTIPSAIVITLAIAMLLYLAVALAATRLVGFYTFAAAGRSGAPLETIALATWGEGMALVIRVGAIAAMLAVVLNLITGLSRVILAMARRGDMPHRFSTIVHRNASPVAAVVGAGVVVAGICVVGTIESAWTFSAVTVLIYYALTNTAALRLPAEHRRYPRILAVLGLAGCVALALVVPSAMWRVAGVLMVIGVLWRVLARRLARSVEA